MPVIHGHDPSAGHSVAEAVQCLVAVLVIADKVVEGGVLPRTIIGREEGRRRQRADGDVRGTEGARGLVHGMPGGEGIEDVSDLGNQPLWQILKQGQTVPMCRLLYGTQQVSLGGMFARRAPGALLFY